MAGTRKLTACTRAKRLLLQGMVSSESSSRISTVYLKISWAHVVLETCLLRVACALACEGAMLGLRVGL